MRADFITLIEANIGGDNVDGIITADAIASALERAVPVYNRDRPLPPDDGGVRPFHVVTDEVDTIPITDRGAVAYLAAADLMEQLASYYTGAGSPTIDADSADWQSRPAQYATRAKRFRELYASAVGISKDHNTLAPAGAIADWDRPGRILHRNR